MELSSLEWVSSVGLTSLVEDPSLVGTVMAVPPVNMSVVTVVSAMNIQALTTVVSDVSD